MIDQSKVIAVIDVETTGTVAEFDQVIEFGVQKGLSPVEFAKSWRFKPTIPIPPESTQVHGISDDDVNDCLPFSSMIKSIRRIIEKSDIIIGYNIRFDINMLQAEFQRAEVPLLDFRGKCIVDPFEIWKRCEPRTLSDAVKRFAKREHDGAHSTLSDVMATGEVLLGMINDFKLNDNDWKSLASSDFTHWVGGTTHIKCQNDKLLFGFGKYKNKEVFEVLKMDADYVQWICSSRFPVHVKKIINSAFLMEENAFISFMKSEYGLDIS